MTKATFVEKSHDKVITSAYELPYGTYFISKDAGKEALFFRSTIGIVNLSGLNKGGGVSLEHKDYMDRSTPVIRVLNSVTITENE